MAKQKQAFAEPKYLRERLQVLQETQRAMLNILEDFDDERLKYQLIQKATMNLLEDVNEIYELERRFSILLQRAILPAIPVIGDGYSIAVEYVPAFASREIGGDFYDVYRVSDCRTGILIGDVSGKGLEAAGLAAATRSTVHAFIYETASAAEALARANAVISSSQILPELFVTVFLVVLDTCRGTFNYSNAGHPPAMICRASGNVEILDLGEIPLALDVTLQFSEHSGHLGQGDKLVLYTDGISEARHGSAMLEMGGVQRILQENIRLHAADLAQVLTKSATDWAGGKLSDDAAVVVIDRTKKAVY